MSYSDPSSAGRLPREFKMASGGFGRFLAPFILVLVFLFVIMLALGSALFGGNAGGGFVVAVLVTGVMVAVLYGKFDRMQSGTVVRFSEQGIELQDTMGYHVQLHWPDITHIGRVVTQMADPKSIDAGGAVSVGVGSMRSLGVIGWGHRATPARMPAWRRDALAQQPVNPADGRPLVAIPLGEIDPNWLNGAMGEWVRRYRPDLFAQDRQG